MAKRHKGGFASNSDLFAKRGDPWITQREGIKDFGRNPETEDPEYDFDHRFHSTGTFGKPSQAPKRVDHRDPLPDYDKEIADIQRHKASISRRMQMRINRRRAGTEVKEAVRAFRICDGCRSARCVRDAICYGALK